MSDWSTFEEHSFLYLKEKYPQAKFEKLGEHDANKPDIKVFSSTGKEFCVETKMEKAQCGQFVLIANQSKCKFEYSVKNKYVINDDSQKIITHMDENFEIYKDAGTSGVDININTDIFYNWIKAYYKNKNVEYFITGEKSKMVIVPIDNFEEYFYVSAKYRMKKSGSASPSKKNQSEVIKLLNISGVNYSANCEGKKMLITSNTTLNKVQLVGEKYTYLLVENENGLEVRQLSNTCNSNVIFSIKLKSEQKAIDLLKFESEI